MSAPYRGDEVVLYAQRDLFRWNGPKAGFFLFGTLLGTVVITSRRFLFLSTGQSGLTGQFDVLASNVKMVFGQTPASELNLEALANEGSIELPLHRVRSVEVKRRWDFASYLSVRANAEDGRDLAWAFMSKIGLNPEELRRVAQAFDTARAQA